MMHTGSRDFDEFSRQPVYVNASDIERIAFEDRYGADEEHILPRNTILCALFVIGCFFAFLPIAVLAVATLGARTVFHRIGEIRIPGLAHWDDV
ncbi:hypothetical protein [Amaricoccus macauensis]|uniref:hypothetical protein n=1 Tax=Amaricoccus macauensis TaxID=57001 RepID=UPI003C7C2885